MELCSKEGLSGTLELRGRVVETPRALILVSSER